MIKEQNNVNSEFEIALMNLYPNGIPSYIQEKLNKVYLEPYDVESVLDDLGGGYLETPYDG